MMTEHRLPDSGAPHDCFEIAYRCCSSVSRYFDSITLWKAISCAEFLGNFHKFHPNGLVGECRRCRWLAYCCYDARKTRVNVCHSRLLMRWCWFSDDTQKIYGKNGRIGIFLSGRNAIDIALPPAGCSGFVCQSVAFSLSCFVTLCVLFREARFHQPADEKVQIRWSGVPLLPALSFCRKGV